MDFRAVFNLFLVVGAIQGFVFAFATFAMRRRIEKPILYLNLFVVFLSLNNLQSWLIDKGIFLYGSESTYPIPWYILIVPMFYTFLLHYLQVENKNSTLIGQSISFFVVAVLIRFSLVSAISKGAVSADVLEKYNLLEDFLTLSYSLYLYVRSILLLKKHQDQYRDVLAFDNLKWVVQFLRWGGLVFLFWILAVVINSTTQIIKAPYSYYPLRLTSSILIYWVAYKAFFRYRLLKDRIGLRALLKKNQKGDVQNPFGKGNRDKFSFERFDSFIHENQLFLESDLSMEKVADQLGVGISTLSKAINENDMNFSDYINTLRVNEAKKVLKNSEFENYTIAAIGLECGFNSKSTFYTAFKKVTGQTPSQFREEAS